MLRPETRVEFYRASEELERVLSETAILSKQLTVVSREISSLRHGNTRITFRKRLTFLYFRVRRFFQPSYFPDSENDPSNQ